MAGYSGCTLLADGRVLLVPCSATSPLIYDPRSDTISTSAAVTPPELQQGMGFCAGQLLLDGQVLLPINYGDGKTVIFDSATDRCSVTTPASHPGGYHCGGALLADGNVLLLPGQNGDLVDCRIWDAEVDTYVPAPELVGVPPIGQGAYAGGCVLPDGRVVFTPYYSRHLVVWDPGLGASFGRDVALSGFWNHP